MNRLLFGTVAGFAALATGAGGLTAVSATDAAASAGVPSVAAGTIDVKQWGRCKDKDLRKAGAECANIRVLLDYANPGGRTITLAAARIRATAPASRRQGTLLGEGRSFPLTGSDLGKRVRAEYDLVGYDVRGTGESRPLLNCGKPDPFRLRQPAYLPTTGAGEAPSADERAWLRRWETFTQRCATKYGAVLEHFNSTVQAYDIDAVRGALGLAQVSLYAGGYAAQVYASLFPQRVRRIVFVATQDPRRAGYASVFADTATSQVHLTRFWGWIAAHHDVYRLGATGTKVERRFLLEQRKLARIPAKGVGPAEWSDQILFRAAFDEQSWPTVASAIAAWVRGDQRKIREGAAEFAAGGAPGTTAALMHCADGSWPSDYGRWRSDAFARFEQSPLFAFPDMLNYLGCRTWPVSQPLEVAGAPDLSMLLVAAGDDTSYHEGALELRRRFPGASYLTVPGSITNSAFGGNACVDRAIRQYLADGTLPPRKTGTQADASCKAIKLPKPLKKDMK